MTIDPMVGLYMRLTPYHYCMNNPILLVDPTGMHTIYDLDRNPHEVMDDELVTIYQAPPEDPEPTEEIDFFSGLKAAWSKFWGIDAREELKSATTSDEMFEAKKKIDESSAAKKEATETIKTVNTILITTAFTVTGVGIAAEGGGILVTTLYNVASDVAQQAIVNGNFDNIDFANAIMAG